MSTKNHSVTDLAVSLEQALSEPVLVQGLPTDGVPGQAWSMVRLEPGAQWTGPGAALATSLIVLEGAATVTIGDWRYTGASGHLFNVGPGSSLEILNDGPGPFSALLQEVLGAVAKDVEASTEPVDALVD